MEKFIALGAVCLESMIKHLQTKPNKRINPDNLLRCAAQIAGYARRYTAIQNYRN